MKTQKMAHATLLIGGLFFLTANSVWANAEQDVQESVEAAQQEASAGLVSAGDEMQATAEEMQAPVEEMQVESEDAQDGTEEPTGLNIVMDGSSLDAWNQSMEEVKEVGGPKEHAQLQDAFDYLLMFDIGAKNDPETLASRLDGLTGNEILKRVRYRKAR